MLFFLLKYRRSECSPGENGRGRVSEWALQSQIGPQDGRHLHTVPLKTERNEITSPEPLVRSKSVNILPVVNCSCSSGRWVFLSAFHLEMCLRQALTRLYGARHTAEMKVMVLLSLSAAPQQQPLSISAHSMDPHLSSPKPLTLTLKAATVWCVNTFYYQVGQLQLVFITPWLAMAVKLQHAKWMENDRRRRK